MRVKEAEPDLEDEEHPTCTHFSGLFDNCGSVVFIAVKHPFPDRRFHHVDFLLKAIGDERTDAADALDERVVLVNETVHEKQEVLFAGFRDRLLDFPIGLGSPEKCFPELEIFPVVSWNLKMELPTHKQFSQSKGQFSTVKLQPFPGVHFSRK